jgi:hypothetical protein
MKKVDVTEIAGLAETIWPVVARLLRGRPAAVQGAALADLTATWLAGHQVSGDPVQTYRFREELLEMHIEAIRNLIPENARIMGTVQGDPNGH